jgi:hypothetical protein
MNPHTWMGLMLRGTSAPAAAQHLADGVAARTEHLDAVVASTVSAYAAAARSATTSR